MTTIQRALLSLPYFISITGLALLLFGAFTFWRSTRAEEVNAAWNRGRPVEVESGKSRTVPLLVTNRTLSRLRIHNIETGFCMATGCVTPRTDPKWEVRAGAERDIEVIVEGRLAGPIKGQIDLFLTDGTTIWPLTVKVTGTCVSEHGGTTEATASKIAL